MSRCIHVFIIHNVYCVLFFGVNIITIFFSFFFSHYFFCQLSTVNILQLQIFILQRNLTPPQKKIVKLLQQSILKIVKILHIANNIQYTVLHM